MSLTYSLKNFLGDLRNSLEMGDFQPQILYFWTKIFPPRRKVPDKLKFGWSQYCSSAMTPRTVFVPLLTTLVVTRQRSCT